MKSFIHYKNRVVRALFAAALCLPGLWLLSGCQPDGDPGAAADAPEGDQRAASAPAETRERAAVEPDARHGDFFAPAADRGADLDPEKLYPQGRIFPFFGFGGNSRRDTENGFTMLGRMYGFNPEHLLLARELDTHVIVPVSGPWNKRQLTAGEASPEEIEAVIREKIEDYLDMEGEERIAWWYLGPEELRHWRRGEMEYLEVAANTIRETDPFDRPVWMYDPGHRNAGGLRHTARHLGIVGKGMYTNYSGIRDQRVWCRWTIEQQKQAIEEANPGAIPIAVPEMFQDPGEEFHEMIPDWVRHDVYAALIAGARGVAVFSLWTGRPDLGDAAEPYYETYATIASELTRDPHLGQVFLFGEERDDITVEVTAGPETVTLEYRDNPPVEYPSVDYLDVAYDGQRYLFLVNSTPETVEVEIGGFPGDGAVRFVPLFEEEQSFADVPDGNSLSLTFRPWQVYGYVILPH